MLVDLLFWWLRAFVSWVGLFGFGVGLEFVWGCVVVFGVMVLFDAVLVLICVCWVVMVGGFVCV